MTSIQGVKSARVLNSHDPENLGRVQVRVTGLADTGTDVWARVAMTTSGAVRGSVLIPQVGDEVIVAFDHGDMRLPVVIGTAWNAKDQPPASNDSNDSTDDKSTGRKPVPPR